LWCVAVTPPPSAPHQSPGRAATSSAPPPERAPSCLPRLAARRLRLKHRVVGAEAQGCAPTTAGVRRRSYLGLSSVSSHPTPVIPSLSSSSYCVLPQTSATLPFVLCSSSSPPLIGGATPCRRHGHPRNLDRFAFAHSKIVYNRLPIGRLDPESHRQPFDVEASHRRALNALLRRSGIAAGDTAGVSSPCWSRKNCSKHNIASWIQSSRWHCIILS
jgi:hypothetical protein